MPTLLYDLIDPRELTEFARTVPDRAEWTLSAYLPERLIDGIKYRIRNRTRTTASALWRVYDAETPIGSRNLVQTAYDGLLPPLGTKLQINEYDRLQLEMARGADNSELIELAFDDVNSMVLGIRASMEKQRGLALSTGAIALPTETGLTLTLNFSPPGSHTPTPSTLWSAGSPTPLTDEMAWIQTLRTETPTTGEPFGDPAAALTSTRIVNYLFANAEYRTAYYAGVAGTLPGRIPPGLANLNAVRSSWSLPPIVPYDVSIDGTKVIADNKFILIPGRNVGETQFGTTAESLILSGGSNPRITRTEAPGIVAVTQEEGDPPRVWNKVAAIGMPVIPDPNQIFAATVAS